MNIQKSSRVTLYRVLLGFILVSVVALLAILQPRANAISGQVGSQQVTLNPGGGVLANGSDGMRFTINSDQAAGNPNYAVAGGDGVVYKNTYQYCCSAGAPALNIGGKLYGQAGAAQGGAVSTWSSISIVSTTGTASVGARTSNTGSASAIVRYTVEKNDLTYTMDREVSYTYPNDFVSDKYTFTIPSGNEETMKFYLGGDTAPGSSDQGYGIVLTSPVRSIISLNTTSQIMFGFREDAESKPFDGATSQHYAAPYNTLGFGGDIGFVETASNHDAGLMMQWNLGSTPGVQTATLEQFVTSQGTNLNASFSASKTKPNVPVTLNISAANTILTPVSDVGYTFTLPAGLKIGTGAQNNTCSGTVTAVANSSTVVLSGGSVGAGTNCLVSVPVMASNEGIFTISAASAVVTEALNNNIGTSSLVVTADNDSDGVGDDVEAAAPNEGDGNNDGTSDSEQLNVASLVNPATGSYSTLAVEDGCELSGVSVKPSTALATDAGYLYPMGLFDFSVSCGTPGFTTTVKQYFYDAPTNDFVLRKFANNSYQTVSAATMSRETIDGRDVLVVAYDVVDGGELDEDGEVNGVVVDPAGPAQAVPGAPNTGFLREGSNGFVVATMGIFSTILAAGVTVFIRLKMKR